MPSRGRRSRRLWLAWAAAAAGVLVLGAVVLLLPGALVTRDAAGLALTGAERVDAVNQVRTTLLQGLGGLILSAGVIATWLQLRVARDGQVTDRFTRAVDQLGNAQIDVRIGGVYALERIARDSKVDRATVVEVLAAFVRQRAPWPPSEAAGAPDRAEAPESVPWLRERAPDVHAAMAVLCRADWRDRSVELQLNSIDLRRAYLPGADLEGAYMPDVNLQGARLRGAILRGAYLGDALLQGALLSEANLEGIHLHDTRLDGAYLRGARLDGAYFHVREGRRGASLVGADLRGARLGQVDLAGIDLSGARGDASTIWPPGFDPVAAGVIVDEADPGGRPAMAL